MDNLSEIAGGKSPRIDPRQLYVRECPSGNASEMNLASPDRLSLRDETELISQERSDIQPI
jgi:hypothetical protein